MSDLPMGTLKHRVAFTLAATVLTAACGMLAGYLQGRATSIRLAQDRLTEDSSKVLSEVNAFSLEAHTMLAAMNTSAGPFCSESELAGFRKLLLHAQYLIDAGRLINGKIACSAALGNRDLPTASFTPQFSQPDGSKVYRDMTPYRMDNQTPASLQIGDSFVVFRNSLRRYLSVTSIHHTTTAIDAPTGKADRVGGEVLALEGVMLTSDNQGRVGDTLYATRCSAFYNNCVTSYLSIPETLQADRSQWLMYMVVGGALGGLFGFFCALIHDHNRGIEQQLRRAIRRDALGVLYQPLVELPSGRIVGTEALARWTNEDNVAVAPDIFIKLAEDRGFVGEITELVVRRVLREFAQTLNTHPDFRLSVNVTGSDLRDPEFLPMLERSLARAEVWAQNVSIEITESSTAQHPMARETMRHLRERGHSIHIDDFGTGYSSLSYLHDLSVDAIKIDRTFTRAIGTEAVTVAILPQILALAAALKLQVIVEGIETKQQADYFAGSEQPILAQGWYFGHPLTAEAFQRSLAEQELQAPVS